MPFDLEKASGTYIGTDFSHNFREILQELGDPQEFIVKIYTEKTKLDFTVSGKTFTVASTMKGRQTFVNTYTIGEESDEKGMSGAQQGKVLFTMEGDDLVAVHTDYDGKGGVARRTFRWIDDNTILTEYEVGGLVGYYKAVKV